MTAATTHLIFWLPKNPSRICYTSTLGHKHMIPGGRKGHKFCKESVLHCNMRNEVAASHPMDKAASMYHCQT